MRVAVVIPCLDEAPAIGGVLEEFREALPEAELVVVDNGSTDGTGEVAASHGATVLVEPRRGKGNAVRTAFRSVEADVYLLVDGDGTYPAAAAAALLAPVLAGEADVAIGGRLRADVHSEMRALNRMGNALFRRVVNGLFGAGVTDLLTGYRAMTREFVKQVPVLSTGFELEAELTILALERGFRTVEVPVHLSARAAGTASKIRIAGDGIRILGVIFSLLRDYRPLSFFAVPGIVANVVGLVLGVFVTWEFSRTGAVRVPTAVLATGLELAGFLLILTGVMLTAVSRRFRELEHQIRSLRDEVAPPPVKIPSSVRRQRLG